MGALPPINRDEHGPGLGASQSLPMLASSHNQGEALGAGARRKGIREGGEEGRRHSMALDAAKRHSVIPKM